MSASLLYVYISPGHMVDASSYVSYNSHASLLNAPQVMWSYGIKIAFKGHICGWDIFCISMINKCCSSLIFHGNVQ